MPPWTNTTAGGVPEGPSPSPSLPSSESESGSEHDPLRRWRRRRRGRPSSFCSLLLAALPRRVAGADGPGDGGGCVHSTSSRPAGVMMYSRHSGGEGEEDEEPASDRRGVSTGPAGGRDDAGGGVQ
jgi:hypothetical protein